MSMSPHGNIWVVIAAYNEATAIAGVIADVTAAGYRAVVVDDGSRDRTAELAASAGAALVRHPINLGQGAALQTGIEFAVAQGADTIVTFDADGQHRAADIAGLVDALAHHNADFALGSRFLGTTVNMPTSRRWLLMAASWFTRATTGLSITDSHNGLRAMTRRGASHIQLRQNRMAHASEILHQIASSDLKYVETPVTIHYSAYSLAKGQTLFDAVLIVLDLLARRLYR
jgi:glycosyltransferase involved in cell wall biosynthesis